MDYLDQPKFNPPTLADVVWDMVDALALVAELAIGGELARSEIEALDSLFAQLGAAASRSGMSDVASRQKRASEQLRLRFGNPR